mgnify:CR=1 FL=1
MTNPTKMSLKNLMEFLSTPDGTSQNLDQNSQPGGAVHWNNLTSVPEIIKKVTDGEASLLINWRGDLASAPVPAAVNDAYRNTTTKTSYLYTQTGWVVLAKDGVDGQDGQDGTSGTSGSDGTPGTIVEVGSTTTGAPGTLASVAGDTSQPGKLILNFTIPRGADGADGAALPSGAPTAAPVISSPLAWNIMANTPSTYLISAYNSPTSFSATGLPVGLSLNASSGLISGGVSAPLAANASIAATNVLGTDTKTLSIVASGEHPLIVYNCSNTKLSDSLVPVLPMAIRSAANVAGTTLAFVNSAKQINPANHVMAVDTEYPMMRSSFAASNTFTAGVYDYGYLIGTTTDNPEVSYTSNNVHTLTWTPGGFVGVVIKLKHYLSSGSETAGRVYTDFSISCIGPVPYSTSTGAPNAGLLPFTDFSPFGYYYDYLRTGMRISYIGSNMHISFNIREVYARSTNEGERTEYHLPEYTHVTSIPSSYFTENRREVFAVLGFETPMIMPSHNIISWSCLTV